MSLILTLICSCTLTRRVSDSSYMLTRNIVEEDKSASKSERITKEDVEKFIQPKPNRRLLGTNLYLQFYNISGDSTQNGFFRRLFRRWGDPPVLLDSTLVRQSVEFIHNYTVFSGFYDANVSYRVDTLKKKKATVTYTIEQNEPYTIGEIEYDFRDAFLRPIIMQDSAATLLRSGDVLDGNVLTNERVRLMQILTNNGYFDFSMDNIRFQGDSTVGNNVVDLTVQFRRHTSGYTPTGERILDNNSIYRIGKIVVNPDHNIKNMISGPEYYSNLDTLHYRGLDILHRPGANPKVRKRILRQAVTLYPNYIYNASEVQQTRSNLMRLGFYRNTNILLEPILSDTLETSQITFIGGDADDVEQTTTERYLICMIECIPAYRQSYKIELEGTTTSNYYGLGITVGYQNRNLFRGAELFDASITGGYEFMRTKGRSGSFELGGAVSMSFPRFIFPIKVDPYNRSINPRTRVELSINSQRRYYYHRTVSGVNWGYSWSDRKKSSFTLRPIDVNLVKLGYIDPEYVDYLDSLNNNYLKESYQSQLVAGISGSYVYNSQLGSANLNDKSFLFRLNWETAGNLINGFTRLLSSPVKREGQEYYRIFGIRYSQYFRVDASISDRIILAPRTNIAFRLYGGVGMAYGNSSTIPFDRFFYAGGSNSMRGWVPRTLGPGNQLVENKRYNNQVGNVKLEANAELRFPVWGMLNGAAFFDVGNVWYLKDKLTGNDVTFDFGKFYKQLGFNTGLGARFDIGMAVIRLDWGMRLHDPNKPAGERWVSFPSFKNSVLNFGVGYPF